MKEIKFRAWDKKRGAFLDPLNEVDVAGFFNSEHYDIMQYTGLKDKSGIEIYEGDIVEFVREQWMPEGPLKKYRKALDQPTLLEVLREADAIKDGEVIGNIYENPELLK